MPIPASTSLREEANQSSPPISGRRHTYHASRIYTDILGGDALALMGFGGCYVGFIASPDGRQGSCCVFDFSCYLLHRSVEILIGLLLAESLPVY